MVVVTSTLPTGAGSWLNMGPVDQLRLRARNTVFALPGELADGDGLIIGSGIEAALQIPSSYRGVSREHARAIRDEASWQIEAYHNKNALLVNGESVGKRELLPGMEIRLGEAVLIAESPRLRDLRSLLCRLIGWHDDQLAEVDFALQNVSIAAARNLPLMLCAEDSHVAIARWLHEHVKGGDRPFCPCERRGQPEADRPRSRKSARVAAFQDGMAAYAAAAGGTLVMRRNRTRCTSPVFSKRTVDVSLSG